MSENRKPHRGDFFLTHTVNFIQYTTVIDKKTCSICLQSFAQSDVIIIVREVDITEVRLNTFK